MKNDTVAAISSPIGEGGIGVIRISGEDAIAVADKCFQTASGKPLAALGGYHAAFGNLVLSDGAFLDEGVATVFRAPKSYTGENVVELSLHGGTEILRQALRRVLECGASPAQAGEFTKRAYLNGKMPLSKAESVMGLISAKADAALKISRGAAGGSIDRAVKEITELLKKIASGIAAYSDFPDEELEGARVEDFSRELDECDIKLDKLIKNYDTGKLVREGIDCAIVGKPNVGKSTLMNLLCKSERSIVTPVPGTTRDVVETTVALGDITLNLSDTAGIHATQDVVENIGVDRAVKSIDTAAVILAVFDGSNPLDSDDRNLLERIKGKKVIVVINKNDLEQKISSKDFSGFNCVLISAKNDGDAEKIEAAIKEICSIAHLSEKDAVLINERQLACVKGAKESVDEARQALASSVTVDAVGVCVDDALACLLELTGEAITTAVCDEIFKRFCVGK